LPSESRHFSLVFFLAEDLFTERGPVFFLEVRADVVFFFFLVGRFALFLFLLFLGFFATDFFLAGDAIVVSPEPAVLGTLFLAAFLLEAFFFVDLAGNFFVLDAVADFLPAFSFL